MRLLASDSPELPDLAARAGLPSPVSSQPELDSQEDADSSSDEDEEERIRKLRMRSASMAKSVGSKSEDKPSKESSKKLY